MSIVTDSPEFFARLIQAASEIDSQPMDTPEEFSQVCGVQVHAIYRMTRYNAIPLLRIGTQIRIPRYAALAALSQRPPTRKPRKAPREQV